MLRLSEALKRGNLLSSSGSLQQTPETFCYLSDLLSREQNSSVSLVSEISAKRVLFFHNSEKRGIFYQPLLRDMRCN